MDILCIDTSQKALTVGIVTDDTTTARNAGLEIVGGLGIFYHSADCGLKHSQTLLCRIDELLTISGKIIADIDAYFCVVGPGSFTGIRIGITTARAFAQIFNKPCLKVNSLQLAAYNINGINPQGIKKRYAVPLIDAMQDKFYSACYDMDSGVQVLAPDTWHQRQTLSMVLKAGLPYDDTVFICEQRFNNVLFEQCDSIEVTAPCDIRESICAEAVRQYRAGEFCGYEQMLPEYAAVSQAEKNLSCK